MATDKEYKAVIDALSGECERLHKENEELKKALENHDTFMKYAYSQGKQDALSQEPTVTSTDEPMTMVYPTIVCDDAISREELLKAIDTWDKFGYTETGCFVRITKEIDNYVPYVHLEDVITAIQKLPPVTQKSGRWIKSLIYENIYNCSKCGSAGYDTFKYCPNCGARMVVSQRK